MSCYDVTDSAAVTDSVIVSLTTQQSLVASDGLNPLRAGSTAWDSVNNVTITKASDVNLVVNTVLRPPLKTIDHRFIRWRLVNNGAIAKNIPRCRITYTRKGFAR